MGRQNLVVATHTLFSHLATDEGDLRLQRQFLRAEVVASQQGHTTEHTGFVTDEFVVVSIITRVARVETEAGNLVDANAADEVRANTNRTATGDTATAFNATVENINVFGELRVHRFFLLAKVNFFFLHVNPRSMRSDMLRIHLPVFTERSPISSKAGSGANVNSVGRSRVSVRQARPGLPLIIIAQEPQIPARQTKSN
ncbi:hypothetical protein EVA_01177 [gut metagenome]|uniref:Uncharacterized protein n=1 Tax=gut metagenome TaxID=749906 RepID=J9DC05_9ZZZZ